MCSTWKMLKNKKIKRISFNTLKSEATTEIKFVMVFFKSIDICKFGI